MKTLLGRPKNAAFSILPVALNGRNVLCLAPYARMVVIIRNATEVERTALGEAGTALWATARSCLPMYGTSYDARVESDRTARLHAQPGFIVT